MKFKENFCLIVSLFCTYIHTYIHTYVQTDRQTDRQADGLADRYDEANNSFSQIFYERA
jgi:hypothetical protein